MMVTTAHPKQMDETERELIFLRKIGTWSEHPGRPNGTGLSRRELLVRYRNSMQSRDNWGSIDKKRIETYLKRTIGGVT